MTRTPTIQGVRPLTRPPAELSDFGQADLKAKLGRMQRQGEADTRTLAAITGEQFRLVELEAVVAGSPVQARAPFDPESEIDDAELVASLHAVGQITPVVLEALPAEGQRAQYRIVAGHRRIAALRLLDQRTVKAVIVQKESTELALITLAENIYRPLTAYEAWQMLRGLVARGLNKETIAQKSGRSLSAINRLLRIGELGETLQNDLQKQQLSLRVALALSKGPLPFQTALAQLARDRDLTEKQAEALAMVVREDFVRLGAEGVDMASLADSLGLPPTQQRPPMLAPKAQTTGRKPKAPLAVEEAANLLCATFPETESREWGHLAALFVRSRLNRKLLRLAGLYLAEGRTTADEAAERAQELKLAPDVRQLAAMLEALTEINRLMAKGQIGPEAAQLLRLLAQRLGKIGAVKRTGRGKQAPK